MLDQQGGNWSETKGNVHVQQNASRVLMLPVLFTKCWGEMGTSSTAGTLKTFTILANCMAGFDQLLNDSWWFAIENSEQQRLKQSNIRSTSHWALQHTWWPQLSTDPTYPIQNRGYTLHTIVTGFSQMAIFLGNIIYIYYIMIEQRIQWCFPNTFRQIQIILLVIYNITHLIQNPH